MADSQDDSFRKVYNVVLLSQTGAGKSTFVNCIANYFLYETLDDALHDNDPFCVVPSQFEVVLNDMKNITIKMAGVNRADERNETFDLGASSTVFPRWYSFYANDIEFNVLDVAGFSDVGGMSMDERNRQLISNAIQRFGELHGICVLLKATDGRFTGEIEYVLDEIMGGLHRNAINNLVFVITHSRSFDYNMGNAYNVLARYIKNLKDRGVNIEMDKKTVFCIDNEAFRYLCGCAKSRQYQAEFGSLLKNYCTSWTRSREAVFNMFRRFREIPSQDTMESVQLVQARTILQCLIGPLIATASCIEEMTTAAQRSVIIKDIMVYGKVISKKAEAKMVEEPKTVCTSSSCIRQENGRTYYDTVCHTSCILQGVQRSTFPEPRLRDCIVMANGFCTRCGCPTDMHMHLQYDTTFVDTETSVGKLTQREAEKYVDEFVKLQLGEQEKIFESLYKLSVYVHDNGIIRYNNAFVNRMDAEIRRLETAENREAVENLKNRKRNYEEQISLMDTSIQHISDDRLSNSDVQKMLEEMLALPMNGESIRELYEAERRLGGNASDYEQRRYKVKYIP